VAQLNDFVATHQAVIGLVVFICAVFVLLAVGLVFIQSHRISMLNNRLDALTQGADGLNLEEVLASHLDTVVRVANDLDMVAARTAVLEGAARMHFSRLGLVRFNPFDDTGGNQSFAIALLDANNDGFVISSLHSRTGTRVYAKAIFEGACESQLSTEEEKAVAIAVSQGEPSLAPREEARPEASAGKPARGRAAGAGARPARAKAAAPAAAPAEPEEEPEAEPAEADATAPRA
jgi:hypothetical protein